MMQYWKIRDELTVNDEANIVLKGRKIVIPNILENKAIRLAHSGHQGIVKTKELLREKVWFPGIDRKTDLEIKMCIPCQSRIETLTHNVQPLKPSKLPIAPWTEVSIDFCDPFHNGEYLLEVMDDYSRFVEVEIVNSTSARAVIPKLDKMFSTFGIPAIVKSDNGPPVNGEEFTIFSKYLGFKHRKITPHWSQANGLVERFMQPLMKCIRCAHIENRSWKQELYNFLRNYQATPQTSTKVSPAFVMFKRNIKTTLPEVVEKELMESLEERNEKVNQKMKERYDMKCKPCNMKIGDKVFSEKTKKKENRCPL